jgi:DNA-binding IclR family transcriptional regulator
MSSGAEIAFVLLRTLATGRALWGTAGALSTASLCGLLHADPGTVAGALDSLSDEGLVVVDHEDGLVQLTDRAMHDLLA